MSGGNRKAFDDIVAEAIRDFTENGFTSQERLLYWEERIRKAAEEAMAAPRQMEEMLRDALAAAYKRMIDSGKVFKYHPGLPRWTLEKVRPELRAELDKRILASANLIRLNKRKRVAETLQRFSGWATSIPAGGTDQVNKREEAKRVKKSIASLPFEERRVLIDQGHKLTSSINDVVAMGGGAIAAIWRSNWRQPNYDYREDHKDRDKLVWAVRGSWAIEKGLIRKGPNGYTDEITKPAEEPFCRCWYVYVYTLGELQKLAPDMLTSKGLAALEEARSKIAAMA